MLTSIGWLCDDYCAAIFDKYKILHCIQYPHIFSDHTMFLPSATKFQISQFTEQLSCFRHFQIPFSPAPSQHETTLYFFYFWLVENAFQTDVKVTFPALQSINIFALLIIISHPQQASATVIERVRLMIRIWHITDPATLVLIRDHWMVMNWWEDCSTGFEEWLGPWGEGAETTSVATLARASPLRTPIIQIILIQIPPIAFDTIVGLPSVENIKTWMGNQINTSRAF